MSQKIIRDVNGATKYKLQENKLYNTTTIRDAGGKKLATYDKNNGQLRAAGGKLIGKK